jgi:NAD(P)-dependent dehydrogenase (short-subunit alcohol dehydrogenase family)
MESTGLRAVVITGAASGIGDRLARRLATAERLVLLDSDEERLTALCADLGAAAVPVVVDLADRSALRVVCDRWAAELSTVDLLVLNAGIGLVGRQPARPDGPGAGPARRGRPGAGPDRRDVECVRTRRVGRTGRVLCLEVRGSRVR